MRLGRRTVCRQLHTARVSFAAKAFGMPAMSPTMTKGNIVSWKFQPGERFAAGDVLMEVETDKAQIDVEAQDDGQMARIVVEAGAKDVDVGTTVAYLADVDDTLATLEIPVEEPKPETAPTKSSATVPPTLPRKESAGGLSAPAPLLPSVATLVAQHGLDANTIRATGGRGRLTKGDVLAHLGKIPRGSPAAIAEYVANSSRLDLSNIERQTLKAAQTPAAAEESAPKKPEPPKTLKHRVVLEAQPGTSLLCMQESLQKRIQEAFHRAHKRVLGDLLSEPFTALLVRDPRKPRFSYTLAVQRIKGQTAGQTYYEADLDLHLASGYGSESRTVANIFISEVDAYAAGSSK